MRIIEYKISEWNGFKRYDFVLNGKNAILIEPAEKNENRGWLLKTEYFGAFPGFEIEMLKRGWYVAYISIITRWHKSEDDDAKAELCAFLQREFGLKKCVPVGMSCGGMHAVYFAAKYPEYVSLLYLDAPILNLLSCPCGIGMADNDMYEEFVNHTGLTVSKLINYREHPIDFVDSIISKGIPVFLVCGNKDKVVPYLENGQCLAEKYQKSGVPFKEIIKPGCGHHPHGLTDNAPLIEFIEKYYREGMQK